MPHLNSDEINDLDRLHRRILAAEEPRRARMSAAGPNCVVGTKLLRRLVEADQDLWRLREAGWGIDMAGNPYRLAGDD